MKKLIFGVALLLFATQVLAAKKEDTTEQPKGDFDYHTSDTKVVRAVRNNNPGNVKSVKTATSKEWQGVVGYDDKGHCIFDNYIWGTRAMLKDLRGKINRGLNTTGKIIPVYCPSNDGCDVAQYLQAINKNAGIAKNDLLNANDQNQMWNLIIAMATHEAGKTKDGKPAVILTRAIFNAAWNL